RAKPFRISSALRGLGSGALPPFSGSGGCNWLPTSVKPFAKSWLTPGNRRGSKVLFLAFTCASAASNLINVCPGATEVATRVTTPGVIASTLASNVLLRAVETIDVNDFIFIPLLLRQLVHESVADTRNFYGHTINDFRTILKSFRSTNRGTIKYRGRPTVFSGAVNCHHIFGRTIYRYGKFHSTETYNTEPSSVTGIFRRDLYDMQILTITTETTDIDRNIRVKCRRFHIKTVQVCIRCIKLWLWNIRRRRLRLFRSLRLHLFVACFDLGFWHLNISNPGFLNLRSFTQIFVDQRMHQKQKQEGGNHPQASSYTYSCNVHSGLFLFS